MFVLEAANGEGHFQQIENERRTINSLSNQERGQRFEAEADETLTIRWPSDRPPLHLSHQSLTNEGSHSSSAREASTLPFREASLLRCFIQKIAPWVGGHSCSLQRNPGLNRNRQISVTHGRTLVRWCHNGRYNFPWCSKQFWPWQPGMTRL